MSHTYYAVVTPGRKGTYNVYVGRGTFTNDRILFRLTDTTTTNVSTSDLTKYFRVKFWNTCKKSKAGQFIGINAPLYWIVSIIRTEFDYHLGPKECMKPENVQFLSEYIKNPLAGWKCFRI